MDPAKLQLKDSTEASETALCTFPKSLCSATKQGATWSKELEGNGMERRGMWLPACPTAGSAPGALHLWGVLIGTCGEDKLLPFDTTSREAICVFMAACTCCIHKQQPLYVVPPGLCRAWGWPCSLGAATHRAPPRWPGSKHRLFISRFSSEDFEEALKKWYS